MRRVEARIKIVLVAVALCGTAFADDTCPWLNTPTAAGALGGNVTLALLHSDKNKEDGSCEFTHAAVSLRIAVETGVDFTSWFKRCPADATHLRGIGNEAVSCELKDGGNNSMQVLGRVRDRAFLVRITAPDSSLPREKAREQAHIIAELVAGNLF